MLTTEQQTRWEKLVATERKWVQDCDSGSFLIPDHKFSTLFSRTIVAVDAELDSLRTRVAALEGELAQREEMARAVQRFLAADAARQQMARKLPECVTVREIEQQYHEYLAAKTALSAAAGEEGE